MITLLVLLQNAAALEMRTFGVDEVTIASPGFGAAANSFMDFINAEELYPTHSIPHGLHRRSDPGAGAFTYHHSRYTQAKFGVSQGEELFVSYGNHWFLDRKHVLGPIPVEGDHKQADAMYRRFRTIFSPSGPTKQEKNAEATEDDEPSPSPRTEAPHSELDDLATELWDTFVLNSVWEDSPTMAALPSKEDYDAMYEQTLFKLKKSRMQRSTEWLAENGVCADTMYYGESTIRQAGHGAYASRHLKEGAIVLPIPVIHIPDRKVLDMYELHAEGGENSATGNKERPRPPQLLLNYCLGHRDSTMLLSPYGPVFNLINHNQTLANVKLQWAHPARSQHKPEMLQRNVSEFENYKSAQLAMELVALKDIEPDDEIFLDYGDEWEAAWQKHVEEWRPVKDAETYLSAFEMNQHFDHVYRTEFEQMQQPYPTNLMLRFYNYFQHDEYRRDWVKSHPIPFKEVMNQWAANGSVQCEILGYKEEQGRILYTVVIPGDDKRTTWRLLEHVPRESIFFSDRPYTSDLFLENAFRHDIRIPDELFPEQWKNLIYENQ